MTESMVVMSLHEAERQAEQAIVQVKHPAKFSQPILDRLAKLAIAEVERCGHDVALLDPFAGTGRIHEIAQTGIETVGVELEPEWASLHPRTIVADARNLPFANASFEAVMTSPCYGNRMADHHEAKDGSQRITYKHYLGRDLTAGNSGAMQWGLAYRELHLLAWRESLRVLVPDGLMVVNISDHIRKGEVQPVVEWHLRTLRDLGMMVDRDEPIETPRMRRGANYALRVQHEHLLIMRKP